MDIPNLELYFLLQGNSLRAFTKIYNRNGSLYHYHPRGDLLARLAQETGDTIENTKKKLLQERQSYVENILGDLNKLKQQIK